MNDEFESFLKEKITSLLRISDDVFNDFIQSGKNKNDLYNFFSLSPSNTTLFFILYKNTHEYAINEKKCEINENCKNEMLNEQIKDEYIKKYVEEEKIDNYNQTDSYNEIKKENIIKREDLINKNEISEADESLKKSEKEKNDNIEDNNETKKKVEIKNNIEIEDIHSTNTKDTNIKSNSECEQIGNNENKEVIHYVLKMSINNININDSEEEYFLEKKKQQKKKIYKQILFFLKIKNEKIGKNIEEYFNNNYTFGNLHYNYINNLKTYFKVFFIPFFQCLIKKKNFFEYNGTRINQNVRMKNVLNKLENFKKNENLNKELNDSEELNINKYLDIIENDNYIEEEEEEEEMHIEGENFINNKTQTENIKENILLNNKSNMCDILNNNDNNMYSEKKNEEFLSNKNLLNSFYYLLNYYKQILKVEQISYNEINGDLIKLKGDTINIDNYLKNISNIIKDFIIKEKKNDLKKKNDKTVVEYWKERFHRVYNLLEQINSKKFEQIIENIKGKIYNNELCNEIKLLLKEIENMHIESFEMIKFSKILESSFETLKFSHINQMKNSIKLVMRKLKNIWLSSKYFRKDEIIIAFFLRLSEIIFEFILFLAIKIKKLNKPKKIKKFLSKCTDILKFYEKEFIYVKLDIETIDIRKNWYFDKSIIFKNIRHLQHVLATLYTVYSEIIYFTDLCLIKLKKLVNNKKIMNNIILEINKLYEPFNDVLKNIYLYDDESIMLLMKKLNEQCLKIEKKCIKIIYIQFSHLRNTKSTYLLVEKFQNLKKNYKIDRLLIKKLYDILFLYKKELYSYIDLFNNMCTNKDLDIYKRMLFCLNIYKKIKKPILIFKNNNYITSSNEYKIIVKLYINFCKKMFSYIVDTYFIWKNSSLSQMNKILSSNIITINKQLNFYYVINFDNNFFKTIYEYAYIESIYDFNTPIEILNMYNLKKKLYRYLYELNEIIIFFKSFTTTKSIIEQKVLIKFFQCFEQKLIYISNNINWLNLNIDYYITDLKNCKSIIENVYLSLSYSLTSIDKIIYNMQNVNVVRYIDWGNMKPLHIQPFFNYFEEYRINEINKILQKYKEISQILIKIEQIVEKTKNGRSEIMDELYYLYQCKIYKCLSLIIIKGLCNYETLIENDFQKKVLDNYKPCLYIKEDIYSDVFLNNSIQNIFKLISKLLTNLLLSSSEFIRWLDYSCIEVPISLKEDFEFFKMKFSFYQSVSKNKIIIDRIIHIHQLIQNVFQKANKYIYSFLKYDNIINSIIKAQSSFNIHQNISYPLIYYDNILKNITNIQNKIDKENDKKTIQFISLNISFVLNSIKNKLLDSKKFFFNNLHFIFTTLTCSTMSEITKYSGILKTATNSMDKYENIIKTINTIKTENINIEINIQKTEEIYNILTIYEDNNINEEQKKKLFLLYPLYLNMLNIAFFNDNLMFSIKQEFYKNTKNKIILFEEKVKNILKKFHLCGPSSENINLNEGMESLKKYINDFKLLEIEKDEIIKAQILCNMKILLFENFYLLKNTIKIYNSIYSIYNSYTTRINDFLDVIYYKLNIREINKSLKEVKNELLELEKDQPEAKNILAYKKINEELNKMNTTLIIVYLLQNTNMKLTNWHEIINLHSKKNKIKYQIKFENNIIINDKNINIKSITLYDMHELKIYLHFNDIKYIIYKIKEVEKLENYLNKIENNWKQESLKIKKYNDYFILDDNKNIFKNIKKTFSDLHLMRNLNFAHDLIPKINYLQNKLHFIYEFLSLWILIQEKWINLERFYNNENFSHFSNELKNFNKINKTYIEIMKNAKKNLNLFQNCNTQFFYFLKNYYDRVLFLSKETLNILQDKKFAYPDFFFLSDEELLDLLSNTETENLKKYCYIIYEDLLTFNDIDKTIIEIITTKKNIFNLKNGLKIIGIDTYVILKEKIKSALKESIVTCLKNYHNTNKIIPIIINNISVISNIVIKVVLSEEMKYIIQTKSINYTNKSNDLMEELKKEKGKNVHKLEQSIIIFLEFINMLKKAIQENLFDENNFFLYYQFRYILDKNNEHISVKYGNYTFKYNYDILENNDLFVNILSNNKYIYSICSNIQKSYYNIICGKNKTSTIKYITSTLGLRSYFIKGSANNIKNILLGVIQSGYSLIFQNVDEVKVEILSVLTNIFRSVQTCLKKKEKNIYIFNKDITFNSSSVIFFTSKSYRCGNIPINLKNLCKEVIINTCQEVELIEILLYINNFSNIKHLCVKILNFMEYLNFVYFNSNNNILNDIINIISLCRKGNNQYNEYSEYLLIANYIFIYYYDKLKNIEHIKFEKLINKFFGVELITNFNLKEKRDSLKELLKNDRIYLKDDLFYKYEKDIYVLKEKLDNQFLSIIYGNIYSGKTTLLKIYNTLYNYKYSFIYLDSLYDSFNNFNESFLYDIMKKKQQKNDEYTFIMKLNYLNPIVYNLLSLNKLIYYKNQQELTYGNKLKIIIECNNISFLDPYLLNKMNKISIKDNINIYNYFKKNSFVALDCILNANFFSEKNIQNNKNDSNYINNHEEKKKIIFGLYDELKLFYRKFFLHIFNYINKRKGENFNIANYYTKNVDMKNIVLSNDNLTKNDLFNFCASDKIIINNFIDIFKSNFLIFLKECNLSDELNEYSKSSNNNDSYTFQNIETLHKDNSEKTILNENINEEYASNEEYNLDNIDKNYIENICLLQAERENNKKIEKYNKKEILNLTIIKNKAVFILISCLIFVFNNLLIDNEKSNFFTFLKKLCIYNDISINCNLTNCFYHIKKDKWVPISEFFNIIKNNEFDEKHLIFYDEEIKKKINSISLLYKGESNICLIGNKKNCKTTILKEIINKNKNIDHVIVNVLKYTNVLNFKILHDKLIKKNVKRYIHESVFYICIDDIHINYEKLNNHSVEFLQNLQRNLCYFENKIINIENIKSIISLDFEQIKKNSYYQNISYYYSFFFLNTNKKCLVNYFNALISYSLHDKFQTIHNKLVSYSLEVLWKIHEDINFEEKKENNLLFTKENIFLLYEDFFYTKTNFQNEQDVIKNWCENTKSIILNRILKKENKEEIKKKIENIEHNYFPNLINENLSTYLNYFSKDVHEKVDIDLLKDEFVRSLSNYNNMYMNAKIFVEFYFKNIVEIYKKISKNINASMIICMNKKRAVTILNAVAYILNINTIIINKSNKVENMQDKINYFNKLRFQRNLFILINYSNKYNDYFYSLIYKKFPSVFYEKNELFKMYTKTSLISNDLKWENIQNIMKKNTYVCLVHEKRFDLKTNVFQNYKNIYNDINIIHLDSWTKEEYIQYCILFLKNYEDNHFIDNILNNFKKKVILNNIEDDIEKENKTITIKEKEKEKEKEKDDNKIFVNSLDYIKQKKEENNIKENEIENENATKKEKEKKNDLQISNKDDNEKGERKNEKSNEMDSKKVDEDEKEIEQKKEKEGNDENEKEEEKINQSRSEENNKNEFENEKKKEKIIKEGITKKKGFRTNKNIRKEEQNNSENKYKNPKKENKSLTKIEKNKKKNEDKLITTYIKKSKNYENTSNVKNIRKGTNNIMEKKKNNNEDISKSSTNVNLSKSIKKKDNIEGTKKKKALKVNENINVNIKKKNEKEINKFKNKIDGNNQIEKKYRKYQKTEDNDGSIFRTNKFTKENHDKKLEKKKEINIFNNYDQDNLLKTTKNDQHKAETVGETNENENVSKTENVENMNEKINEINIESESKGEIINNNEFSKEKDRNENDDLCKNLSEENSQNLGINNIKKFSREILSEYDSYSRKKYKYNICNIIENQHENIVNTFIEVYYDLKNFLKKNKNLDFIRVNKCNFMDSLIMFYILLKNKLNYKNKQLYMFKMSLKKINIIFENYENMYIEIESINSLVSNLNDNIVKLNDSIKINSKLLIDIEEKFNSNKKILNKVTNDIDEMIENKNESEKQIEEECISIIFKIQNVENNEIKNILKMNNPDVILINISIMLNTLIRNSFLNDNIDNWNYFKNFLSKDNFSKFFFNFKKENVTDKQIKRVKEYMNKDEIIYNTQKIYQMNNLFSFFFEWITFIIKYKEYYKNACDINVIISNNKTKKEKYESENQKLLEEMHRIKSSIVNSKNEVNDQSEQIEDLNKKLNVINKSYLPFLEIKKFLEKIKNKYTYTIEKIESNYKYLVSEILLFSFFLNYSSSFNYKYRCYLLDTWKKIIKKNNILIKDDIKIENIYSCDSIISLFISDNFPRHIFYIQNALISLNHFRWPLFLDQQNIGIDWLKKSYSNNLVIHNFDENLSKHLDMCIIYGKSLIIPFFNFQNLYIYEKTNDENYNCEYLDQENFKNIKEDLLYKKNFLKFKLKNKDIKLNSNYSIIEPIIERNIYLLNGKYYINIGMKKLEYNNQFRLFLVSDTNDRYFEDIEDYVNIIDFQIDKNLIINKIVNIILKHEDEKKVINFNTKIRNFYETKQTLKFLDDGMILELCAFNNKINNHNNLINAINNNVLKKMEIKKLLKEYKNEIKKIKNSSDNIKYLGYRFYSIYKVLQKQSKVKSVYNFNFNYLLNILNHLIKNINKKMLICNFNQLIKKFTHNCFVFFLNTINTKDKLFFCFLFYTSLIFEEKKLNDIKKSFKIEKEKYYSLFMRMKNLRNIDVTYLQKIEWLNTKKKKELMFLGKEFESFKQLIDDLIKNSTEYYNWYKQTKPEDNFFFLKRVHLDKLETILFIYVMRKDRLYYYIYFLLQNYLDLSENLNCSSYFSNDLNYLDTKTFLYIVEPYHTYDTIPSNNNIKTFSVGNNFNSDIQIIIETSLQNGKKLLLENIHLINFNIEKFYEIYNNKKIHSNFELYLTSEKNCSISINKKAIKIYSYREKHFKSFLIEFFTYTYNIYKDKLKNNFMNSFLFSLAFFHSILVSRCNYDNFGFDELYYFDNKDFEITFDCLLYYFDLIQINNVLNKSENLNKNKYDTFNNKFISEDIEEKKININWNFIKDIILNGYGNKVNYMDRKIIKSYINEYFNEYSFNEKNEFIYSMDEKYNYKFLLNRSAKEYMNLIKSYPSINSCKMYGMKIEADKKKYEEYNNTLLSNLRKICKEEILIYKKENNDKDVFFNLESDYYSSSLMNTDEDENIYENIDKTETLREFESEECTKEMYESKFLIKINSREDNGVTFEQLDDFNTCDIDYFNLNFLKNIKKMNEFYELIKKLKMTLKNNLTVNSEWNKTDKTTIQYCCINETKKFKEITNIIYNDVIKIEKQLNKNKKNFDIDSKEIMFNLSISKIPKKWSCNFNKKIKTVDSFIKYYERIKEQLYFWNISGELKFYNIQYLFYPSEFFKALLIKYSCIYKKNLKDCIFICKIDNEMDINKKENVHLQKNIFYSSDEETEFLSKDVNYTNYVHYDTENHSDVYLLGFFTMNDNFECLGIKSKSNKKYDEIPIIKLDVIEKKKKNILKDKKIPLYQNMYNGKLKKKNNMFITNLYFNTDKHKSLIYINKIYLFIYN
ncbi:dynein heavy chain, putative [Plasmodium gallinaceum]|uniref:Dynein heavy chain, putative n=1 Tax=Plasmodium gallinaceum TaxID=5849 RepID=A0A1J1GXG2_PLAGA|nr:dynein heavy chain, putative [Plasmodium gallinaceum]CRG95981.1 dynein heavy chain, putative [Plasmodium gallinaceum]